MGHPISGPGMKPRSIASGLELGKVKNTESRVQNPRMPPGTEIPKGKQEVKGGKAQELGLKQGTPGVILLETVLSMGLPLQMLPVPLPTLL